MICEPDPQVHWKEPAQNSQIHLSVLFIQWNTVKVNGVENSTVLYCVDNRQHFHFWMNYPFNKWKFETFKDKYYIVWLTGFAAFCVNDDMVPDSTCWVISQPWRMWFVVIVFRSGCPLQLDMREKHTYKTQETQMPISKRICFMFFHYLAILPENLNV